MSLHVVAHGKIACDLKLLLAQLILKESHQASSVLDLASIYHGKHLYLNSWHFLRKVLTEYNNKTHKQFVIIIDEYDDPFNQVINNKVAFEGRFNWFNELYKIIKGCHEKHCLRFLFITGITRYSHTDILSGFNNLKDFTNKKAYCTLFGYTEKELQKYFGAFLKLPPSDDGGFSWTKKQLSVEELFDT